MKGIFPYLCVGKSPHINYYSYLCTRYGTTNRELKRRYEKFEVHDL